MINATQIRKGNILIRDGVPHRVLEFQHRTPGKGAAFVRVLLRNLTTGASYEQRLNSNESVERATLEQRQMDYLYSDGTHHHFMDTESFEQMALDGDMLGDQKQFLKEGAQVDVQLYEGRPIGVDLPTSVVLQVTETEPELRGATASNSPKPATLETGAVVQVPPFIKEGDLIKVNTLEGTYQERVK